MVPPSRGLADVVAASTALSDIDGRAGRLSYRGYDVDDLAARITFEECVYLLHRGRLPTEVELTDLVSELAAARTLPDLVTRAVPDLAARAAPMEALRSAVSLLGHEDPDKDSNDPAADQRKAVRLVAAVPALIVQYAAARGGGGGAAVPEPDPRLGIAGNFLLQVTRSVPSPEAVAAFDECLVLHADHTLNASTFAARVCAATLSDMHSAVVAAIATLRGPLHGGANEAVMRLLESLDRSEDVEGAVRRRLSAGERIPGFGHRVYRGEDPRASRLRPLAEQLSGQNGSSDLLAKARSVEATVLAVRGLYPNVDFFAPIVYASLGIATELFPAVFAMARTAGWTAHVMEQHADNRLIRPESEYVGERNRTWVPIPDR